MSIHTKHILRRTGGESDGGRRHTRCCVAVRSVRCAGAVVHRVMRFAASVPPRPVTAHRSAALPTHGQRLAGACTTHARHFAVARSPYVIS
ncbi:hypothetical protein EVAR_23805_1 [Eumeta japonica]|uniref:Uncharacterized protein n=1 Tax=Eumeta variegata TaxID=151549 RepID=A0A4C1VNJ1_EUMVA|nr:hypothetical protein EVAR_23805_1 [Eumeta japonica]